VTDPSQVAALFAEVRERFGGLDLLSNNAGLGVFGSFEESKPEDWHTMIDTNLIGILACTQVAIPLMRGRPGAMIASVASTGGRYGVEGWSVYCATKYAFVGFHETLRKELASDPRDGDRARRGLDAVRTQRAEGRHARAATSLDPLRPEDVAQSLVYAFAQPPLVRPVKQIAP
jgi:NADP-dependent 3-hydroxy acid dehydrogenase YdfG